MLNLLLALQPMHCYFSGKAPMQPQPIVRGAPATQSPARLGSKPTMAWLGWDS